MAVNLIVPVYEVEDIIDEYLEKVFGGKVVWDTTTDNILVRVDEYETGKELDLSEWEDEW